MITIIKIINSFLPNASVSATGYKTNNGQNTAKKIILLKLIFLK